MSQIEHNHTHEIITRSTYIVYKATNCRSRFHGFW